MDAMAVFALTFIRQASYRTGFHQVSCRISNLSKGVKIFYDLADSDLEESDFIEILEYLDQRFHRKCYSLSGNKKPHVNRREILQIIDSLEKKIDELAVVQTGLKNDISEVQRDSMIARNELETRFKEIENNEYISSKFLCDAETYRKCSSGECCLNTNTKFLNLALGKPAKQSSNHAGKAGAAVDGNRNSDFGRGLSCIHTENDKYAPPWWMVDLEAVRQVGRVIIVNRGDGSCRRLKKLVVTVSLRPDEDGEVCGTFPGPGACRQIIEMVCPKKLHGQYVKLTLNNPDSDNYLHVCEVEVYSE